MCWALARYASGAPDDSDARRRRQRPSSANSALALRGTTRASAQGRATSNGHDNDNNNSNGGQVVRSLPTVAATNSEATHDLGNTRIGKLIFSSVAARTSTDTLRQARASLICKTRVSLPATMLSHVAFPALPAPASWYPGHMTQFARMLPALLTRTDVVLELRDARLPLTSINRTFEGALQRWRTERVRLSEQASATAPQAAPRVCERVVVFSKRDLVPEWGLQPFCDAMAAKFPDQRVFFASWNKPRDLKSLSNLLVSIAKSHPHMPEINVLVVGMPNVGKSTLLNALRNIGIPG
ncbi:hypothetical protein EVG20_g11438, partial [Dentipellis fragilis]